MSVVVVGCKSVWLNCSLFLGCVGDIRKCCSHAASKHITGKYSVCTT